MGLHQPAINFAPTPSIRAKFTERRTYLRPLNEEGDIFETPKQALDRVMGHQKWLWEGALNRSLILTEKAELQELRGMIEAQLVSMSGRVKWMGGTEIVKTRASGAFNCSFKVAHTPADLTDIFWLLLQGAGVGFRPKPGLMTGLPTTIKHIKVIPSVRNDKGGAEDTTSVVDKEASTWTIKFGDSAKAWAKGLGKLTAEKPRVETLVLDYSELRPGGKRLKGYGWLSSGWEPLMKGFLGIVKVMQRVGDALLNAIDIGDMINWLGTVLSSRRSAQIWLREVFETEWDDILEKHGDFIDAKVDRWEKGEGQREQSNNSLVFMNKPSKSAIAHLLVRILLGGEPGFVNGEHAKRRAPEMEGLNPCVVADTWILTGDGPRQVRDLIDVPHKSIVNGKPYAATGFWKSGHKKVFNLKTDRGYEMRLTEDHKVLVSTGHGGEQKWVETKDLKPGDLVVLGDNENYTWGAQDEFNKGWLLGEVVGDGCYSADGKYAAKVQFWGDGAKEIAEMAHSYVDDLPLNYHQPVRSKSPVYATAHKSWLVHSRRLTELCDEYLDETKSFSEKVEGASSSFIRGVLGGWFDADGTVIGSIEKGRSIRLASIHLRNLKAAQRMLAHLGIISKIYENRRDAHQKSMPDGKGGHKLYDCQTSHELVITRSNMARFAKVIGFKETAKQDRLELCLGMNTRGEYQERFTSKVESVVFDGMEDVYDCTVDEVHRFSANGMIVHNCAEILLPDAGFCNLVQVVWHRFNGNYELLKRAQWLAARANYRQTCVSMKDGVLQLQWEDNQKLLRLCGVSPTGYVSWEGMNNGEMLEGVRDAAIAGADAMADDLGLQRSRRVTQVQPAGTSSKALGIEGDEVHEGAHCADSRWIFNDINFSKFDVMTDRLKAAGYHVYPNPNDPTGVLVRFPVAYPESPLFTKKIIEIDGRMEEVEINEESAINQLERYRILMKHYVQHNCSITVSFDESEIPAMVEWFDKNWDDYVGVSFLQRNDPTKTAADLGFKYLPQSAISKRIYEEYVAGLSPVDLDDDKSHEMLDLGACAAGGACPVR